MNHTVSTPNVVVYQGTNRRDCPMVFIRLFYFIPKTLDVHLLYKHEEIERERGIRSTKSIVFYKRLIVPMKINNFISELKIQKSKTLHICQLPYSVIRLMSD
jgi:hypothetical protein